MSLSANLSIDASIADETDSVGNSGPFDSGLYDFTVAMAYTAKSKGGALSLVLHLATEAGRELRQTLWMTSGDAKGNKNFYETQGEKKYLPGFNAAESLGLLAAGESIASLVDAAETKIVNIYNFVEKKEIPTEVPVLTKLLGKPITAGVFRQTVDKNINVAAEGEKANYQPSGESREENEIDKFFRSSDHLTTAEIRAQTTEAAFYETWGTKWSNVIRDRQSAENKKLAGSPKSNAFGAATGAGTSPKPTSSLFSNTEAA